MIWIRSPLTDTCPRSEAGAWAASGGTAMTRMQARMAPREPPPHRSGMHATTATSPVYVTSDATTEMPLMTFPSVVGKESRSSISRAEGRSAGKSTNASMEAEKEIARLKQRLTESKREEEEMEMVVKTKEIELLAGEIAKSQHRRDELQRKLHPDAAVRLQQYPSASGSAGAVSGMLTDRPIVRQVQHGGWYTDRPSAQGWG